MSYPSSISIECRKCHREIVFDIEWPEPEAGVFAITCYIHSRYWQDCKCDRSVHDKTTLEVEAEEKARGMLV